MKILVFLQNQWFKNPEKVRAIYERSPQYYEQLVARFLFVGCLTGRRLRQVFGDGCMRDFIWCEASPQIGGHSSSVFPADPAHMARLIEKHKPDVVLTFGKIAADGILQLSDRSLDLFKSEQVYFRLIGGPHPAARGADTMDRLRKMAERLKKIMEEINSVTTQR